VSQKSSSAVAERPRDALCISVVQQFNTLSTVLYYRQACAKRSHAAIVLTQWSKNGFFAPQRRHVAPINVKFGNGPQVRHSAPAPCQILSGRKCRNTAPKTVKISNFGNKFVPQGRLVCSIFTKFSVYTRLCVAFKFLIWSRWGDKQPSYKHFPRWWHFPSNFQ